MQVGSQSAVHDNTTDANLSINLNFENNWYLTIKVNCVGMNTNITITIWMMFLIFGLMYSISYAVGMAIRQTSEAVSKETITLLAIFLITWKSVNMEM